MNKDKNKELPIFTGNIGKKIKFKNKIIINKDPFKDSLFGLHEEEKKKKYLTDNIYCDFIKIEKQNKANIDSIRNLKVELDKKIGKTTETYRFKSPFRKL